MSTFETIVAAASAVSAGALMGIASHLAGIRKEVAEIWRRMPRLD